MNRSRSESALKHPGRRRPIRQSALLQLARPVEEPNPLVESVRDRLSKLRDDLYTRDLEDKYVRDQRILENAMLEEEIQNVISHKIREAVELEESRSLQSGFVSSAPSRTNDGSSVQSKSTELTRSRAVHTFPGGVCPRQKEHGQVDQGTSFEPPDNDLFEHVEDDLTVTSGLGGVSLGSSWSSQKRPALIILRKSDINLMAIKDKVKERLPSPEKPTGDARYPTPSCTAALIAQEEKHKTYAALKQDMENKSDRLLRSRQRLLGVQEHGNELSSGSGKTPAGSGKLGELNNNSSSRNSSTRWSALKPVAQRSGLLVIQQHNAAVGSVEKDSDSSDEDCAPIRPAPFLKARSSSGIVNSALAEDMPVVASPPKDVVGEMVRGLSVAQIRKAVRGSALRASQQFTKDGSSSVLGILQELQGTDILDSRYGGWAPVSPSASSKLTIGGSFLRTTGHID